MEGGKFSTMRDIKWENENIFSIDGVTFVVEVGGALYEASSQEQKFVIGKSRRQLESLQNLHYVKQVQRICDLGIYKGGSVMFYYKLFAPEKIVAIDLSETPVEPLDKYIRENDLGEVIRTYYGVDQSDKDKISDILRTEMAGHYFDIVVDDASHLLHQTKTSFNLLFPYVAPGGYYIIEDWGWAHWESKAWQENGGPWPKESPLSNLIFELTMLLASRPDLIGSIYLLPAYAVIKKGNNPRSSNTDCFDLSRSYFNRGKKVRLLD
jgi:hypothetical protein